MAFRQAIRYFAILNFALGTVLIALEISISMHRSAEMDPGDLGVLHEQITALAAGTFTAVAAGLILCTNEKPPRRKTSSYVNHITGLILALVGLALLIATLGLFFTEKASDRVVVAGRDSLPTVGAQQHLEETEDDLLVLVNCAIVTAFILLFTLAFLAVLFACQARKMMVRLGQPEANLHAERIQKYRQRMTGPNNTFSDFYSATIGETLDVAEDGTAADEDQATPLPKFDPQPALSFRPYLDVEKGGYNCSMETQMSAI